MLLNCQPPMIPFTTLLAFPRTYLPLPTGSSYNKVVTQRCRREAPTFPQSAWRLKRFSEAPSPSSPPKKEPGNEALSAKLCAQVQVDWNVSPFEYLWINSACMALYQLVAPLARE